MRINNSLEINSNLNTILDKLIFELRKNGSTLFSRGYKDLSEYISVQCPFHKGGQEKHPSAQFRKSDGLFFCFACKKTKSLPDIITQLLKVNGKAWLLENFDGSNIENREVKFDLSVKKPSTKYFIAESDLAQYNITHPYMFKRKLTLDIIKKFNVGYDKDYNIINDGKVYPMGECITFPVKDINGNIVFIARRSINQKVFNYPKDVDKPVYGLYEIYEEMKKGKVIDEVYICESFFNCLTIWSYGKYAVALIGTGSNTQLDILKKSDIRHFILALDPDEAGRKGTKRLLEGLTNKFVETAVIPEGKDVNDLTKEEFEALEVKSFM